MQVNKVNINIFKIPKTNKDFKTKLPFEESNKRGYNFITSKESLTFRAQVMPEIESSSEISRLMKKLSPYCLPKDNISDLSISERKYLIKGLAELEGKEILQIKNGENPLLENLVQSIGNEIRPLSDEETRKLNENLFKMAESIKDIDFSKYTREKGGKLLTQEIPTKVFIKSVEDVISNLNEKEKIKALGYFGFNIESIATTKTIFGYPKNNNLKPQEQGIVEKQVIEAIEKLRPLVVDYTEHNKIKSKNKELEESMNEIVKLIPELHTIIAKEQHKTHDFTIDTHSFKVLSEIMKDSKYQNLSDSDKKVMILASLFHDITKIEGVIDKTHPKEGGFDTFYISQKLGLTKEEHRKLYTLVKNHDWSEHLNTAYGENKNRIAKELAQEFGTKHIFHLAKMFSIADLIAVKENGYFYTLYGNDVKKLSPMIEKEIENLSN